LDKITILSIFRHFLRYTSAASLLILCFCRV